MKTRCLLLATVLVAGTAGAEVKSAAERIESAHRRLMDEYLSPQGLILDYPGELPTPEECRECRPNAMGWWCPIENGVMFTAPYLQAAIRRAETKKGTPEFARAKAEIEKMTDGLLLAASVSDVPGFIARGFATDGKSHHPLGSTCQSSAWFVGMYAYAKWSGAEPAKRVRVIAKMKEVAKALEANKWNVPADQDFKGQNRGGFVSEGELQFRAATHWLYTLMLLADITGERYWWDEYVKARDSKIIPSDGSENRFSTLTRLEICERGWAADGSWAARADTYQMWIYVGAQESLAGLIELEPDWTIKVRYRNGLQANARRAKAALAKAAKYDNRKERPFKYANWRTGYRWEKQTDQKTAEALAWSGNKQILGDRKAHERAFMTEPCSAIAVCGYAGMFREEIEKAICCYDFNEINLSEFLFAVCGWYALDSEESRLYGLELVTVKSTKDGTEQPCWFWAPEKAKDEPVPLLVTMHPWSYDYRAFEVYERAWKAAREHGWAFVGPNCRGPNRTPAACGSELAVGDVVDAIAYAKERVKIDDSRVYMIGGSGAGYLTLLMMGRHPELFAAGVAYCPITDLARWHADSLEKHPGRCKDYAKNLEGACGGTPAEQLPEYRRRSALTYLARAKEAKVPIYICTGIHDGWIGSVPVGHAIRAFNVMAEEKDRLSEADIAYIEANQQPPEQLRFTGKDPFYDEKIRVYLRRDSKLSRLTLFDGGHQGNYPAGIDFLSRQVKGHEPDWSLPSAPVSAEAEKIKK